jgi:hypothetical protein
MGTKWVKMFLGIIAFTLASINCGVNAEESSALRRSNDVIKSRPATANSTQKYRPKRGCFATGTRDASGNSQIVC